MQSENGKRSCWVPAPTQTNSQLCETSVLSSSWSSISAGASPWSPSICQASPNWACSPSMEGAGCDCLLQTRGFPTVTQLMAWTCITWSAEGRTAGWGRTIMIGSATRAATWSEDNEGGGCDVGIAHASGKSIGIWSTEQSGSVRVMGCSRSTEGMNQCGAAINEQQDKHSRKGCAAWVRFGMVLQRSDNTGGINNHWPWRAVFLKSQSHTACRRHWTKHEGVGRTLPVCELNAC